MNTQQIDRAIRRHVRDFDGVFSRDNLPPKPSLLVANTDPAAEPGEHWVVIRVDENGNGYYFDSYGRRPPPTFERYMNRHCDNWSHNAKQFQSVASKFCGQYCVCYCVLINRGIDLCDILTTRDTGMNDIVVHHIACRII